MSKSAFKCPVCGYGLKAVQYAANAGTRTPLTMRKYCEKCDKIFKIEWSAKTE